MDDIPTSQCHSSLVDLSGEAQPWPMHVANQPFKLNRFHTLAVSVFLRHIPIA